MIIHAVLKNSELNLKSVGYPWNDLIRRVSDQFQFTRAKVWKMDWGGATLKLRRKTIQGCPSLPLTWNCPLDTLNFLEHSPSLLPC